MPSVVVADVVPLVRLGLATVLRSGGLSRSWPTSRRQARSPRRSSSTFPDLAIVGAGQRSVDLDEMARQVHDASRSGVCASWCCWVARRGTRSPTCSRSRSTACWGGSIEGPPTWSRAVLRVMAGERYVDPALLTGDTPDEEFEPMALTARDREVLGLLASGCSNPRDRVDAVRVVADGEDTPRTHLRQARRPEPQRGAWGGR